MTGSATTVVQSQRILWPMKLGVGRPTSGWCADALLGEEQQTLGGGPTYGLYSGTWSALSIMQCVVQPLDAINEPLDRGMPHGMSDSGEVTRTVDGRVSSAPPIAHRVEPYVLCG